MRANPCRGERRLRGDERVERVREGGTQHDLLDGTAAEREAGYASQDAVGEQLVERYREMLGDEREGAVNELFG